jgi:uncharacterized membrane protein YkgB
MGLAIAMIIAYLPFFYWMYKEAMDQAEKSKTHK